MKAAYIFFHFLSCYSLGKVATLPTLESSNVSGNSGKELSEQGVLTGQDIPTTFEYDTATKEKDSAPLTAKRMTWEEITKIRKENEDTGVLAKFPMSPNIKSMYVGSNIRNIRGDFGLAFPSLELLDLEGNDIRELSDLLFLAGMPKLEDIYLRGNPVQFKDHYRQFVIWLCPFAKLVDLRDVQPEELALAESLFGSHVAPSKLAKRIIENAKESTDAEMLGSAQNEVPKSQISISAKRFSWEDIIKIRDKTKKTTVKSNFPMAPSLKHLNVKNNGIQTIQVHFGLTFPLLEILNLSENNIKELSDLLFLAGLHRLKELSLVQNPVVGKRHYRPFVIWLCPSVAELDTKSVHHKEREMAEQLFGTEAVPSALARSVLGIAEEANKTLNLEKRWNLLKK